MRGGGEWNKKCREEDERRMGEKGIGVVEED